jgi:YaiO family outer membrane protein
LKHALAIGLLLAATALAAAAAVEVLPEARALATSGHRADALRLLEKRLAAAPDDTDARVLYGLILSWEGRYDEARRELQLVLAQHPDHGDAQQALINVELWSGHPDRAEQIAGDALTRKRRDTALMFAQARALRAQNREREALAVLKRLLALDPMDRQALDAERGIRESLDQWSVGWSHTSNWFKGGIGTWNESSMSLKRGTPIGSVTASFTRASRWDLHSNLAEVAFYPSIGRGTYGYLGFGYSYDAALFPTYRLGAEIFQSLPHGLEGSAGYRRFGSAGVTNMYTGSLGKYLGKWLFTGRFYLTPDELGVTHSMNFTARRYLNDRGDYIGFHAGTGPSEFDPRSRHDLETLHASSGYVEFRKTWKGRWVWSAIAGLSVQDRFQQVSVDQYTLSTTLDYRF